MPGDRYFLACRFANELGAPLAELSLSKYIGETEKNLRQIVSDARKRNAILLFDEAEALFTKRGAVPSRKTRVGRNSDYLLQAARRYPAPVLFSTAASGPSLKALENLIDIVVEFGHPPDQAQPAESGKPVTGQNFRVFVGKRELGICHVSGLASTGETGRFEKPGAENPGFPSVTLRRAITPCRALFSWYEAVRDGQDGRRDVRIDLLDGPGGDPVVSWRLRRARPIRWSGPSLDGLESAIAMEELEIAFERLEWR
jgi:phage tail-like protein